MTIYSLPSDRAYTEKLQVLEAGQRWFAFDVPIADARKKNATRFGMAIWNYHCIDGTRDFERWGITKDPETEEYWYRVAKPNAKPVSQNHPLLWDALHIAANMPQPFPMTAILKDGKTHRCSPDHVFDITDIQIQDDGSALWLKLQVPLTGVGTEYEENLIPSTHPLDPSVLAQPPSRQPLLKSQYLAIRDAAVRLYLQDAIRAQEIEFLHEIHGINKGTANTYFSIFSHLVEGKPFKSHLSADGLRLFVDGIIAKRGESVLPNLIRAIEGYVDYRTKNSTDKENGFQTILRELKQDAEQAQAVKEQVMRALPSSNGDRSPSGPVASEILREVWVRGPQHAAFRRELQRRWSSKCSVHGVACNDQLRASHIVAWSIDEALRGDVNNGLLLSVPLDNLFDRGLISFDDAGAIILSNTLTPDTCKYFGVHPGLRIAWDHLSERDKTSLRTTLARHRAQHGLETSTGQR
ncbi:HNH endonuclease [Kerstersia gyiorum]|uniref:HNH endonuclease n=1 Tax=Kerstersia gyiorum TaxID=206506 RepID=UPI003B43AAE7